MSGEDKSGIHWMEKLPQESKLSDDHKLKSQDGDDQLTIVHIYIYLYSPSKRSSTSSTTCVAIQAGLLNQGRRVATLGTPCSPQGGSSRHLVAASHVDDDQQSSCIVVNGARARDQLKINCVRQRHCQADVTDALPPCPVRCHSVQYSVTMLDHAASCLLRYTPSDVGLNSGSRLISICPLLLLVLISQYPPTACHCARMQNYQNPYIHIFLLNAFLILSCPVDRRHMVDPLVGLVYA